MANKAYYRKLIIDKRAQIAEERMRKKRDNESFARLIKGASTPAAKASYKKRKIDCAATHDRHIENWKLDIERLKVDLARASN